MKTDVRPQMKRNGHGKAEQKGQVSFIKERLVNSDFIHSVCESAWLCSRIIKFSSNEKTDRTEMQWWKN